MSASADLDLLDPPSLAHSLTATARARQQPHAGSPSSYADAADADADADAAATRTALEAAEKTVALLRAQLTTTTTMLRAGDNESSRTADAAPLGYVQNRKVESQYTGITEVSKQEKSWSGSKQVSKYH